MLLPADGPLDFCWGWVSGMGDSRSIVVNEEDQAVGLVFANDLRSTLAIPIWRVLERMEVTLA